MTVFGIASVVAVLTLAGSTGAAPESALFGTWTTTDGSVVQTFACDRDLCMKIISIAPTAPGTVDYNNPDPALRKRSLCNLEIGSAFILSGADEAKGGRLYDPESGKTYKGNVARNGDTLKLRGYIGVSLFGRTEVWHRASDVKRCS